MKTVPSTFFPKYFAMKGEKRPRVVVAGFGDTGVCCVADLAASADFDLCAVTPKPCHHSAQELGGRIAQPALWEQLYLLPFQEYPKLDNVEIVQGLVTSLDLEAQLVTVKDSNGKHREEAYDVLLISSGVSSGFWRTTKVETRESLLQTIKVEHERIAQAAKVSVVGGGPSVSIGSVRVLHERERERGAENGRRANGQATFGFCLTLSPREGGVRSLRDQAEVSKEGSEPLLHERARSPGLP